MATKSKKNSTGKRYTEAQKAKILAFINARGRGGLAAAQKKFNVSYVAIRGWMRKDGGLGKTKAGPKDTKAVAALVEKEVRRQLEPFHKANVRYREGIKALIKAV